MKNKTALKVEHVGVCFHLTEERIDSLKEYAVRYLQRELHLKLEFLALLLWQLKNQVLLSFQKNNSLKEHE